MDSILNSTTWQALVESTKSTSTQTKCITEKDLIAIMIANEELQRVHNTLDTLRNILSCSEENNLA